ncbi:MAG: riboflavin synthase, partial [Hyphomicrobiaceae bacterium]
MFTGIVTAIGEVVSHKGGAFAIRAAYPAETLTLGASIACDGCCLTVTGWQPEPAGVVFTVDVSNESLARTSLGGWQVGRHVNLERALKAGDELGGHIVTGHVDGVARLRALRRDGESRRLEIEAPDELAPYIASKGSVALDGTSLTVNEVDGS